MLEPYTPGKVLGLVEVLKLTLFYCGDCETFLVLVFSIVFSCCFVQLDFLRCASLSSSLKYFNLSWLFPYVQSDPGGAAVVAASYATLTTSFPYIILLSLSHVYAQISLKL